MQTFCMICLIYLLTKYVVIYPRLIYNSGILVQDMPEILWYVPLLYIPYARGMPTRYARGPYLNRMLL